MHENNEEKYKAVILTEGKTDWKHLQTAARKLGIDLKLKYDSSSIDRGDSKLLEHCEKLSKIPVEQPVPLIFVFDRDNETTIKKVNDKNMKFKSWGNNIFSFALPLPTHRQKHKHISIEYYYNDDEIRAQDKNGRRLYFSSEFNEKSGKHIEIGDVNYGNNNKLRGFTDSNSSKILDNDVYKGDKNVALPKDDFASYIFNDEEGFNNFDFSEFATVFNIIKLITEHVNKKEEKQKKTSDTAEQIPIKVISKKYNDQPPIVQIFVGREEYLEKLKTPNMRVIAVTGLGGEGKSTLAAKFYDLAIKKEVPSSFEKFGWYDCKELETPFHEKLSALLEMLTDGEQSKEKYRDENVTDTIFRFIDFLNTNETLIVFDNVDAFVEKDSSTLTGNLKVLFEGLVNRLTKSLVIFTSRAAIEDHHFSFLEIPIVGLSYKEALKLAYEFGIMGEILNETTLEFIFEKTNGHALWLNLIFAQLRTGRFTSSKINEIFSRQSALLDKSLLSSIWETLDDIEKEIIWIISAFNRPPEIEKIEKALGKSYQKCIKVINTLEKLKLITEIDMSGVTHYDLHPIIMMKAREECKPQKKAHLFEKVVAILSLGNWRFIATIVNHHDDYTSELEGYIECAEIALKNNNYDKAIQYINDLVYPLTKYGEDIKFTQLCKDLFVDLDYKKYNILESKELSNIFESFIKILLIQGEFGLVDKLLSNFNSNSKTIKEFIFYTGLNGYNLWFQNKFSDAINFMESAYNQIKSKNEIVPSDFYHDLALAKRDNGDVKYAIDFYLSINDQQTYDLWDPNGDKDLSSMVGNLGRCYYLNGDFEKSLNYLTRAVDFLKKNKSRDGKVNYGYGLLWISDIYIKTRDYPMAYDFIQRAVQIWSKFCPSRLKKIEKHIEEYPSEFKRKYKENILRMIKESTNLDSSE